MEPVPRLSEFSPQHIDATIHREVHAAIGALVDQGTLTNEGPLTDADLSIVMFLALSAEDLRSTIHHARADEPPAPHPKPVIPIPTPPSLGRGRLFIAGG